MLVIAVLAGSIAVVASQPMSPVARAWTPLTYANPVLGQYPFVRDSGSVSANGFAYTYVVLDTSTITTGDHFVFLPSLNSPPRAPTTVLNITITFQGQTHTQSASGFYYKINIPSYNQTLGLGQFSDPRTVGTSTDSLGNTGLTMFTQARWTDSQTVKLYCYVGSSNTPLPP